MSLAILDVVFALKKRCDELTAENTRLKAEAEDVRRRLLDAAVRAMTPKPVAEVTP